jgi:LPXTG-motif cell wall-anchored protein
VSNTGDGDLAGVAVAISTTLVLRGPPDVTSGSVSGLTWTIGPLAHGTDAILTLQATLPTNSGAATLAAQASGSGSGLTVGDGGSTTVVTTALLPTTGDDPTTALMLALLLALGGVALIVLRHLVSGKPGH